MVIIPDHYIFTADPRANRNVDILRDFVNQQVSRRCTRTCKSFVFTSAEQLCIRLVREGLLLYIFDAQCVGELSPRIVDKIEDLDKALTRTWRRFVRGQDIKYFYDITDRGNFKVNPDYKGVCHVALAQEGHTRPGEVCHDN